MTDKFIISSDSCCDIYYEDKQKMELPYIPLTFICDKNGQIDTRLDDFRQMSEYTDFYNEIREGMMAKTSQVSVDQHLAYFKELMAKHKCDIVHISLSSGLSGTYDQSETAAKMLANENSEYTVYPVDGLSATVGQYNIVLEAYACRDKGMTAKETAEHLRKYTKRLHHWIMVDDLNHLKRGGRISAAAAAVGSLLNIKPIITINHEGKLVVVEKVKGVKKTIDKIVKYVDKYGEDVENQTVFVVHTDCEDQAKILAFLIEEKFHCKTKIVMMGPVIGAHLGPGALAAVFTGKERIVKY